MTERRLSPTAATNRVNRAVRARMKILRQDSRPVRGVRGIDSPRVFADRIASLLKAAAHDHPGEWSEAYCEFVVGRFADRYVELSRVAPLPREAVTR